MNRSHRPEGMQRTLALLLGVLCLGLAASPSAAAKEVSDTVRIEPGEHAAVQIDFTEGPTKDVTYDVQVQDGPNIDVMMMDNANYDAYQSGDSYQYVQSWSDLNTGNTDASFTLQEHGTWYLVLDHTSSPNEDNAAQPATIGADTVTARYTITTQTNVTDEARDRLDSIPGPGLTGTLVGLVGGIALLAVARAR